jgi:hypothetical protein
MFCARRLGEFSLPARDCEFRDLGFEHKSLL